MVRVMASGVFDLLHTGHLAYLEEAKKMGDELIVVVATDKTVLQRKHNPVTPQNMRRELVASLKPVDSAVIGNDGAQRIREFLRSPLHIIASPHEIAGLTECKTDQACGVGVIMIPRH